MMFVRVKDHKEDAITKFESYLNENNFKFSRAGYDQFVIDSLYYKTIFELYPNYEYVEVSSYKLVSRVNHPKDRVISIRNIKIGGNSPLFICAGPCAVEDNESLKTIAQAVKRSGARGLRGGAFKPRTSPYAFQGIGREGLRFLNQCASSHSLLSVSEITSVAEIEYFKENIDIIQVGARNMQNFELLKALGKTNKTILLKRGFGNTIEELLNSAEYIASNGNINIILCERGIRTFESMTRNTLDLSSVAILKRLTNLPVIVDPSHALGNKELVKDLLASIVVAGCDGLLLEVHQDPAKAISDGNQSLNLKEFDEAVNNLKLLSYYIKRDI